MSDLISRNAAIVQLSHNKIGDDDCDVIIQRDIETIKALASPDVRPVVHGKWINDPYEDFLPHCSNCKSRWSNTENMRFCPSCGADMRSKEETKNGR